MSSATTIELGLVSHTNAGKTTLARTLLRRDIGEIGDRAHVTEVAERHVLIESPQGDVLALWDTPGFGDSMRLLSRLRQSDNPLGWVLGQVWDRFTDRPFWSGQQAIRSAREACDVVLYVINATESPEDARYVGAELQILEWIGKPVLVLLNQLGPQRTRARIESDVALWRAHLASHGCIRGVLPLDAFARCWVQEDLLLARVQALLRPTLRPAGDRLREAWHARNLDVFERAMHVIARQLARTAVDEEPIAEQDVQQKLRGWVSSVATGIDRSGAEVQRAQQKLGERLEIATRETLDELILLHGLSGRAATEPLRELTKELAVERPADANQASLLGGLLSGAASGVAADLAVGGLTFGAGAVIGAILGALGARGLTQAYNVVRGREVGRVRWSPEFLMRRASTSLLAYLAVAHFGRGRGEFVNAATPQHWQHAIDSLARQRAALEEAWAAAATGDRVKAERLLMVAIATLGREVLVALYPESTAATIALRPQGVPASPQP
jgi:hypothetical protein